MHSLRCTWRRTKQKKYQGVLRPHWLETTTATLAKKNVLSRVPEWKRATGIHLIRALKESLEKARRTPGLSGVQLLDIRDFPGQGHATTGVLDVFWDSKGIVDPETFRSFNGERVLLMRAAGRTLYAGETAEVRLELSNFGTAVAGAVLKWEWKSEDRIADKGEISLERVPEGGVFPLHRLQVKAPEGGAGRCS